MLRAGLRNRSLVAVVSVALVLAMGGFAAGAVGGFVERREALKGLDVAKAVEEPPATRKAEVTEEAEEAEEAPGSHDVTEDSQAGDSDEAVEEAEDTEAPRLVVTHPEDGAHLAEKHIRFEGETEPGAVVKAGPYQADVDADGHWAIVLVLSPGANRAVFTATDAAGNLSEAVVTVHYDAPRDSKTEEKAHEDDVEQVEFSAHQKFGTCEEDPPYDVFYGTATPGTTVTVVSEHGSGSTTAGKKGFWDIKVYFEGAPHGQTFVVTVESSEGDRKQFEFTSYAG